MDNQEIKVNAVDGDGASADQLTSCQTELTEWKNRFVRLSADFDNYKRRIDLDRSRWASQAQEEVIRKFLPILDDCDRANAEYGKQREKDAALDAWLAGFDLIVGALRKALTSSGVQEITQVKTFDPVLHEAVMHVESTEHASGDIVAVLQKGYLLHGNLLQPARVSVAK